MVSGYAIHLFLGRFLGLKMYGVYGLVIGLINTFILVTTTGIPTAISKYIAQYPDKAGIIRHKALKLQLAFVFCLTIIYYLSAGVISTYLKDNSLATYLRLSSAILPIYSLLTIYISYLNGLQEFIRQSVVKIFYSLLKVSLIIFSLAFTGLGLFGVIGSNILAPLFTLILAYFFLPRLSLSPNSSPDSEFNAFLLIKFAFPSILYSVAFYLAISLDLYFVKIIRQDNYLVSLYTAASAISKLPYYLFSGIANLGLPLLSNTKGTKSITEFKLSLFSLTKLLLFLLLPSTLFISLLSSRLVSVLFPSEFLPAALPLSFLVIGLSFFTIFDFFASGFQAYGKPFYPVIAILLSLPFSVILNWFLIPIYSLTGAALATMLTGLIVLLFSILMFRGNHYLKINALWNSPTTTT